MVNLTRVSAVLCVLMIALSPKSTFAQDTPEPDKDIVSIPNGGAPLAGYLYRPEGSGPFPALIFNHGSAPRNELP